MRSRRVLLYLAATTMLAAAAAALPSCTVRPDGPTSPGDIIITNNNTNNNGGQPNPGASPSPGAVVVTRVGIGQFGETCPSGSGRTPSGNGRSMTVRVGCEGAFTCSPFDAAGKEIVDEASIAAIGPPTRFEAISGSRLVTQIEDGNPYNLRLQGVTAGDVELECVVKGVSSRGSRTAIVHVMP